MGLLPLVFTNAGSWRLINCTIDALAHCNQCLVSERPAHDLHTYRLTMPQFRIICRVMSVRQSPSFHCSHSHISQFGLSKGFVSRGW